MEQDQRVRDEFQVRPNEPFSDTLVVSSSVTGSRALCGSLVQREIRQRKQTLMRTAEFEVGDSVEEERALFETSQSGVLKRLYPDQRLRCLLIAMCGKPARGKTFIARKCSRYLRWLGYRTYVFSLGTYRRRLVGANKEAAFFDHGNPEFMKLRNQAATECISDICEWFRRGGQVGVFDASNVSEERRAFVRKQLQKSIESVPEFDIKVNILWIESICSDVNVIESNIFESKVSSPDYVGLSPEDAAEDYRRRIEYYEKVYETIADTSLSFVKLIDGRKVIVNKVEGFLKSRIVSYLMQLRVGVTHPIYISRHGESVDNVAGRVGGDSELSPRGREYGEALRDFVSTRLDESSRKLLKVWSSPLKRGVQTAAYIDPVGASQWRALADIESGMFDGLTFDEIRERYPAEFEARNNDKLRYRSPRGESYLDVIHRLEPILFELERRSGPVLIIAHKAVLRCLYGYFIGEEAEAIPALEFPLHTVIELVPRPFGCQVRHFELGTSASISNR